MAKQCPDTGAEIRHSNELHFGYLTDVTYGKIFYNRFRQLVHPPTKDYAMYQQLMLIGNLGSDPEMRYTASGVPVTNFRLAVNRRWTNTEGQAQEKTTWFNVSLWRRQAEIASQYLAKGHRVLIIGEVDSARPWTDRDGNLRATIEVTGNELKLMENRPTNGHGDTEALAADAAAADDKAHVPF